MSASLEWPTPYVVGHHAYSAGTADGNNQPIPTYTPALTDAGVQVDVIGWETPKSSEPGTSGHPFRVERTVKLFVLPDFRPGVQDVLDLPGMGQWEVIGIPESADGNPFGWNPGSTGWNPGSTINLRQVTG